MTALVTSAIAILVASCGSEETVSMPLPVAGPFVWSRTSGAYGSGSVRLGAFGMAATFGELALNVFDDDDGVVDDEAGGESDCRRA